MTCEPLEAEILQDPPMVAVLRDFWLWLTTPPDSAAQKRLRASGVTGEITGSFVIKNKAGKLVTLNPNPLQLSIYLAMVRLAKLLLPIRILILKPRKDGASTFIEGLAYFLVTHYRHIYAQVIAHTDPSTRDIFEITARAYVYDPIHLTQPRWPTGNVLSFQDERDSQLAIRTFGGQYPLSSANSQFEHVSELAKTAGDLASIQAQMESLLCAVADTPNTFIFIESTANSLDVSGEFERRAKLSMAGKDEYAFVFAPWFELPEARLGDETPLPPLVADQDALADELQQMEELRAAEEELIERVPTLTNAQLRWRRMKILNLGGLVQFNQSFPSTPDEAFQVAKGKIFPTLNPKRHSTPGCPVMTSSELRRRGYECTGGVDWGGVDPFCYLWVWHNPDLPSGLTIDAGCPNLWRELTGWKFDKKGRPIDRDNHAIDALRYAVTWANMTGHVYVSAEIYKPDFVSAGEDINDCAAAIMAHPQWPDVQQSVADRGRPDCINSFRNQGIPITAYKIEGVTGRAGEIQYGVDRLTQLIVASHPLRYPPLPPDRDELAERFEDALGIGQWVGYTDPNEGHRRSERREALATAGGMRMF